MTGQQPEPDDDFVARLTERLDLMAERAGMPDVPADEADADDESDVRATRFAAAVAAQLRRESTWTGPPPQLRAAVLERALGNQGTPTSSTGSPSTGVSRGGVPPEGSLPDNVRPLHSRRRRLVWAVPLAAAAAAVVTVSAITVDRNLRGDATVPGHTYVASGTQLDPGASAQVTVAQAAGGFSVVLDTKALPPAASGSYYAAWLSDAQGVYVPLGSFHARRIGSPIKLWSGVDPATYPRFSVTLQAEGQPPTPSPEVYLTATIT